MAQLIVARLPFGMGRSNALLKSFFEAVDPKRHAPRNDVVFDCPFRMIANRPT
jgi:amino acid transporter